MGYVTRWNKRGYGFVRCYDDGETYYCSQKVINGEPYLVQGSIVNFQIGHGVDRDGEPMSYAYNLLMVEEPNFLQVFHKYLTFFSGNYR